jgi:hypothetical protein
MRTRASVRTGGASMSVSHRKPPRALYFARIAGNVGNISFGRAFLITVGVRNLEVSLHARGLG